MSTRSKWRDLPRIRHGIAWRAQRLFDNVARWMAQQREGLLWADRDLVVGTQFQQAILAKYGLTSMEGATDPTVQMWVDFALSTVDRRTEAVRLLGAGIGRHSSLR
jgi:hypothetical protein